MCTDCNDKILNPRAELEPYCEQCSEENSKCSSKFPAECVIYNMFDTSPSRLNNLGILNKTPISTILEKIDEQLGKSIDSNNTISVGDTNTIDLDLVGRTLKAGVKVSPLSGNQLEVKTDGLFISKSIDEGKVKVSATDVPDYLKNQVVGGSNGIASLTIGEVEGLLKFNPDLNLIALLTEIKAKHYELFKQLFINVSQTDNTTVTTQQSSRLSPYIAYPYFGPMDIFDGSGKGLSTKGYDKVYICNGINGTPDLRGRVIAGANDAVYGGNSLDSEVNPSQNVGYNLSKGTKVGKFTHILTVSELASHTHETNDPGHNHSIPMGVPFKVGDDNEWSLYHNTGTTQTNTSYTGVTIKNSGSSTAHNNTQPTIGAIYIMYIP